MNWIIDFFNGKTMTEGKDRFDTVNNDSIEKIYFTDGINQYGFFCRTGRFFINNQIFDFKIKLDNGFMMPFQSKTVKALILPNDINESIESWNIGYKLSLDDSLFEYTMSIYYTGEILFLAKLYSKDRTLNKFKELRLR